MGSMSTPLSNPEMKAVGPIQLTKTNGLKVPYYLPYLKTASNKHWGPNWDKQDIRFPHSDLGSHKHNLKSMGFFQFMHM